MEREEYTTNVAVEVFNNTISPLVCRTSKGFKESYTGKYAKRKLVLCWGVFPDFFAKLDFEITVNQ